MKIVTCEQFIDGMNVIEHDLNEQSAAAWNIGTCQNQSEDDTSHRYRLHRLGCGLLQRGHAA